MEIKFERNSFKKRLHSMLNVDFRRMFTMPLLYIMLLVCLATPVLVLVMTSMMDGSVTVDPQTGEERVMEGFKNTWQIIGAVSGNMSDMSMDITSMCNINLLYFALSVLVCIFVSDDFRSGYSKNLFTVRARKGDYVFSKTVVLMFSGVLMLAAFFVGSMFGGAVSGLSFELTGATAFNVICCMLSKAGLIAVFAPISLLASVFAKRKTWLSIIISLFGGMLLFMTVPMMTPLDSTLMNVIMCLVGGAMFAAGLGAISCKVLSKSSLA